MPKIKIPLTTEALVAEIDRRRTLLRKLQSERKNLLKQLAKVEFKILSSGGELLRGRGLRTKMRRPRNSMKLMDVMVRVMNRESPMNVSQIAEAVNNAGYMSTSASFKTIICQTLARERQFKKAGRGLYMLKG